MIYMNQFEDNFNLNIRAKFHGDIHFWKEGKKKYIDTTYSSPAIPIIYENQIYILSIDLNLLYSDDLILCIPGEKRRCELCQVGYAHELGILVYKPTIQFKTGYNIIKELDLTKQITCHCFDSDDKLYYDLFYSIEDNLYHPFFPKIILLKSTNHIPDNAIMYIDKKILGIAITSDSVIPSIYIDRILEEIYYNGCYTGLIGMPCEYVMEKVTNKEKNMVIKNGYSIRYDEFVLEKNDVLVYIDDLEINKDGLVYYYLLNKHIPFQVYLSLNYKFLKSKERHDEITLTIIRKEKRKKITFKVRPIWSMFYLPFSHYYDSLGISSITIRNNTFVVLTYELIGHFIINDLYPESYVMDKALITKYRNLKKNVIILIESDKIKTKEIGKDTGKVLLYVLKKINGKKVNYITDLKYYRKKEFEIELKISKKDKITINI